MNEAKVFENIREHIRYSKGGIFSKVILKSDKLNVTLFCMDKGTEITEHTSTKEGFVYVIEGNGVFTLVGEDIQMLPGVFIHMRNNAVHALTAKENTSFMLVLIN